MLDDLVGLGFIAVVYGISLLAHTWGFLAVFAAAVALRQQELAIATASGVPPEQLNADVAEPVEPPPDTPPPPIVSAEALVFKEHIERLPELLLVLLLGGMLTAAAWNWRTVGLAMFLFCVARPVGTLVGLLGSSTLPRIRGIAALVGRARHRLGVLLMYAIQHGLPAAHSQELVQLTLVAVALSILVHGTSVKPLLARLWLRG